MSLEQLRQDARSKIQHHQCVSISVIMTPDVITLQRTDTIRDAIEIFRIVCGVVIVDEEQKFGNIHQTRLIEFESSIRIA